jgi:hypothetical protein
VGTSFFENVVNAGLPYRVCVINAGPTQVTHVDNALFITQGRVATVPKKATLKHCHHVMSRALSTRGSPHWVMLIMLCPSKGLALTICYMKFL